ncbi:hypothetical protein GQE99_06580 [Maritimibacter sp. DP07]|uniref:Uncharacterized protein n=1 Tax=Maritimibacter harenae TaxID=2606218 RepID=A0A845LY34_9RHOB|nr:hypothetical protein [Maritimibacter harenae]MZR12685.1 hypothetical protein [Maritimibacter harenae]
MNRTIEFTETRKSRNGNVPFRTDALVIEEKESTTYFASRLANTGEESKGWVAMPSDAATLRAVAATLNEIAAKIEPHDANEFFICTFNYDWEESFSLHQTWGEALDEIADSFGLHRAHFDRDPDAIWQALSDEYEAGKWKGFQVIAVDRATLASRNVGPRG